MVDVTLRQMKYFAALSRTLQFRKAARQLEISQPSLSAQVSAFEAALGTRLIERKKSGLILTPNGREVAQQIEKILNDVAQLKQVATPPRDSIEGTLRLGASPTIGPYLLPWVLRQLHALYPNLKLVIRDGAPKELSEELAAGKHDLILTQLPVPEEGIVCEDLYREPLKLVVAGNHRLAQAGRVKRGDLRGEAMLTLSPTYTLHRQLADFCHRSGAVIRDDSEGTSLDALRQMVSLGMGVTLLPALYVHSEVSKALADVAVVDLAPEPQRQIGLVWRASSGSPPAYRKLAGLIRDVAQSEFRGQVLGA